MNNKGQTVCFTGHRQIGEATTAVEARVTELAEGLIQQGYLCFCAGGARGFDALASRVILRLQEKYPLVRLVLVLPFWNQYQHETGWTEEDIAEYQHLKAAASEVIHLQQNYSRGCYYKRNRYLVNRVLLYSNQRKEKEVFIIPDALDELIDCGDEVLEEWTLGLHNFEKYFPTEYAKFIAEHDVKALSEQKPVGVRKPRVESVQDLFDLLAEIDRSEAK